VVGRVTAGCAALVVAEHIGAAGLGSPPRGYPRPKVDTSGKGAMPASSDLRCRALGPGAGTLEWTLMSQEPSEGQVSLLTVSL